MIYRQDQNNVYEVSCQIETSVIKTNNLELLESKADSLIGQFNYYAKFLAGLGYK